MTMKVAVFASFSLFALSSGAAMAQGIPQSLLPAANQSHQAVASQSSDQVANDSTRDK